MFPSFVISGAFPFAFACATINRSNGSDVQSISIASSHDLCKGYPAKRNAEIRMDRLVYCLAGYPDPFSLEHILQFEKHHRRNQKIGCFDLPFRRLAEFFH